MYVILGFRVPTTCGGKGEGMIKGEQRGSEGSKKEVKGAKGSKQGAKGAKGSKGISMLGFRVPTTCGDKKFD